MGMIVQHNMNALNAYNKLNANVAGLKKASEKLSSGYRINRAGDDAAGLAISEKMRSQIRGLNQAVRNSQDGINMIQTFEGAAQETHSILQRMKELASESANGTYDNATDRAALQLEFDQLNDELNQIADTDFNGTVVLNGGEMADGLKAVNGEFNYKEQYDATHDADGTALSPVKTDVVTYEGEIPAETVTDNSGYGAKAANELWDALGIDVNKYEEIDITFVKDDEGNWNGVMVTDKDGNVISNANLSGIKTKAIDPSETATGKGGFDVTWGDNVLHNVFNAYKSVAGDHLTINFKNTADTTYAPTHAAVKESSLVDSTDAGKEPNWNAGDLTFDVELGASVTDENMNEDLEAALDAIKEAKFGIEYADDGTVTITMEEGNAFTAAGLEVNDNGDGTASIVDADGNELLKITAKNTGGAPMPAATAATMADGTEVDDITVESDVSKGDYTYYDNYWVKSGTTTYDVTNDWTKTAGGNGAPAAGDTITIDDTGAITAMTFADGTARGDLDSTASGLGADQAGTYVYVNGKWYNQDDLLAATKIDGGTPANGDTVTVGTKTMPEGKAEFSIDIAGYNVADTDDVKCNSKASTGIEDFQAKLEVAMEKAGVTKANAYNNSTARMTYTDNITLQTGARTKDAVNFSFAYNTDGSADMGDLKANLNISSRADGLNTANLSLANQKDANYAIDQIDKAINKVSMVRATFGSIQNRLEHKITNLTTTSENLQEAESSIRDTDMASEMMNYTKFNILQQAAQSMLAQANQQPQSILQLLG